jgi:hypothetical protein
MRKSSVYIFISILFSFCLFFLSSSALFAKTAKTPQESRVDSQLRKMRLPFIVNEGQIDRQVKYYAKTFSGTVFVTDKGELVYTLGKSRQDDDRKEKTVRTSIKETFAGAVKNPAFKGEGEGTKVGIYKGNDPSKWKKNISTYDLVGLGEIYKGIELKLMAYGDTVEKIFSIKPGSDPKTITARLNGITNIRVNEKGELEVNTDSGPTVFSKPVAYQFKRQGETGEEQREYVQVSYSVKGEEYGFITGDYDKTRELVIDPYVGVKIQGTAEDRAYAVMTVLDEDMTHRIFVAGYSYSSNFPVDQTFGTSGTSDSDVFVARLSEDLGTAERIVFTAGTGDDFAYALAVDGGNNIYVAGTTNSSNLPIPDDAAFDITYNGGTDVFIAKFSYDLTSLISLTYLGGDSTDAVNADSLAIDGINNNVIVAGYTTSTNFPTVTGDSSFDKTYNGGEDVFIAIFDTGIGEGTTPGLENLISSTFIGGSGNERPYGIAIRSGYSEVYVAGYTASNDYPITTGGPYPVYDIDYNGGTNDAFVSRIMPETYTPPLSPLRYLASSTFLGGDGTDEIHGLAVDFSNVYVTGNTNSSNFPGTCTHLPCGGMDVFIAKFAESLTSYPTPPVFVKLGGTSNDYGKSLILSGEAVFVSGVTSSNDFPTTINAFDRTFGGAHGLNSDGFVLRIDPSLTNLDASTYLGGSYDDYAPAIASDTAGNIYVAGSTNSTDFPTTLSPHGSNSGNFEAYVAKLDDMLIGLYTLRVTKTGTGTGTVTSTETPAPKISCGSTCSAFYDVETSVTLNATPSSNSVFAGWNGAGCTGTGSCAFSMNSNNTVTATFTKTKFMVTPIFDENGTMTPSTPQEVNSGQTVSFTITPDNGYRISSVSGSCGGTLNANVYKTNPVTTDCNVRALFISNTFGVSASAEQGGKISPTSATVNYGDTVQFTVTPDDGYHIALVTGCGITKGNPLAVSEQKKKKKKNTGSAASEMYVTAPITAECAVTASFAINTFTVTPSAGEHGNMNPSTPQTVNYNDNVSFSVKAEDGYHIRSVSGCGGTEYAATAKKKKKKKLTMISEMTYTTGKVTGDCTVEAEFAKDALTVTIRKSGTGSGTVTGNGITCGNVCSGTYEAGSKLTLKIKPDDGYRVVDVKINGKSIGPVQTITLKEIMSNYDVEIVFGPV